MKSIKEKSKELSTAFRKEQGDVGYSEQLSYKLGVEAGANYVLEELKTRLKEYKTNSLGEYFVAWDYINEIINELKGE